MQYTSTQSNNATKKSDLTIICRDCSGPFTFSVGEQEFFKFKGYCNPVRCKEIWCKEMRKYNKHHTPKPTKPTAPGKQLGDLSRISKKQKTTSVGHYDRYISKKQKTTSVEHIPSDEDLLFIVDYE